jgi:hypothetical protein
MSAINFPPTDGEPTDGSFKYVHEGVIYTWDGQKWTGEVTGGDAEIPTLQAVTDLGNTTTNNISFTAADARRINAKETLQINVNSDGGKVNRAFEVMDNGNSLFGVNESGLTYGYLTTAEADKAGFGINVIGSSGNVYQNVVSDAADGFVLRSAGSQRVKLAGNGNITATGSITAGDAEPWEDQANRSGTFLDDGYISCYRAIEPGDQASFINCYDKNNTTAFRVNSSGSITATGQIYSTNGAGGVYVNSDNDYALIAYDSDANGAKAKVAIEKGGNINAGDIGDEDGGVRSASEGAFYVRPADVKPQTATAIGVYRNGTTGSDATFNVTKSGTVTNYPLDNTYAYQVKNGTTDWGGIYKHSQGTYIWANKADGTTTVTLDGPQGNVIATGGVTSKTLTCNRTDATASDAFGLIEGNVSDGSGGTENIFMLRTNGTAFFKGQVEAAGTILTRVDGTTLDVKERLEAIESFKTNLKTAITSATDLASVKTAILDALEQL